MRELFEIAWTSYGRAAGCRMLGAVFKVRDGRGFAVWRMDACIDKQAGLWIDLWIYE
jgi:hypothetical protein